MGQLKYLNDLATLKTLDGFDTKLCTVEFCYLGFQGGGRGSKLSHLLNFQDIQSLDQDHPIQRGKEIQEIQKRNMTKQMSVLSRV